MATTTKRRTAQSSYHFTTPKRGPNEQPWAPAHQYQCTAGHWVEADRPVTRCEICVLGEPCDGELIARRTERPL